jgi:hypothetical protein
MAFERAESVHAVIGWLGKELVVVAAAKEYERRPTSRRAITAAVERRGRRAQIGRAALLERTRLERLYRYT